MKSEILILTLSMLYVLVGTWLLRNFPIAFDEAKAFLVTKKVALGRNVGINIHGGSNSSIFYWFYSSISRLFGHDIIIARFFNLFIHATSVTIFWMSLKRNILNTRNIGVALLFFFFVYLLNPFVLAHTIPVDHFSLSISLIILCAATSIEFFFDKTASPKKTLLLASLMGLFIALSLYIRPHMFPFIAIPLLATVLINRKDLRLKSLGVFLLTIIVCSIALDFYLIESLITGEQVEKSFAKFLLVHRITPLLNLATVYIYEFDTANGFLAKILALISYPKVLNTVPRVTSVEGFNHSYILKSFLLQSIGLHVSTVFLYVFSIYGLCFWKKLKPTADQKKFLLTMIASLLLTSIPIFILRYLESTSFSYFYQAFFFLCAGATVILSQLSVSPNTKDLSRILCFFFGLLSLQNIFFLTPNRNYDNPYRFALKGIGNSPSQNKYGLYNLKKSATLINKFSNIGDYILLGHYAVTPFIEGKTIDGLEVNIHKNFFSKNNFLTADENSVGSTPLGTSAFYVLTQLLETQQIAVIFDDGNIHKDLIEHVKNQGLYREVSSSAFGNILIPTFLKGEEISGTSY